MADFITNSNKDEGNNGNNQGNIMRELSDIKQSLATNTEATNNVKENIAEIKGTIKEIQSRYITNDQHKDVVECNVKQQVEINDLKTFRDTLIGKMWGIGLIAGIATSLAGVIFSKFVN